MQALDCDGKEIHEGDTVWAGDLSGSAKVVKVHEDGRIDLDREGYDRELPADWSLAEIAPPPWGIIDPCPGCGGEAQVYASPTPWALEGDYAARVVCKCGWSGPTVPCKLKSSKSLDAAKRKAVKRWNKRV